MALFNVMTEEQIRVQGQSRLSQRRIDNDNCVIEGRWARNVRPRGHRSEAGDVQPQQEQQVFTRMGCSTNASGDNAAPASLPFHAEILP